MQTIHTSSDPKGFTLVEVLIASLLFAVGMMAAMAMQYSMLSGYAGTRDMTSASQVGHRILNLMRAESQQWRDTNDLGSSNYSKTYGQDGNLWVDANKSILERAADNSGWDAVFSVPVDTKLGTSGVRRYCAYVRGNQLKGNSGNTTGLAQVQIAVVYPKSGKVFPSSNNTAYGSCTSFGNNTPSLSDLLKPTSPSNLPSTASDAGYRVVHLGGLVLQRKHLGSGATGGGGRFGS